MIIIQKRVYEGEFEGQRSFDKDHPAKRGEPALLLIIKWAACTSSKRRMQNRKATEEENDTRVRKGMAAALMASRISYTNRDSMAQGRAASPVS